MAKTNGQQSDLALAFELAGRLQMESGPQWSRDELGPQLLRKAHAAYRAWGALAKTHHLEQRFPDVFADATQRARDTSRGPSRSSARTTAPLDWQSLIRASQTLSRKLSLSQLLDALMQTLIQSAGAQRGLLLFPNPSKTDPGTDQAGDQAAETPQWTPIARGSAPTDTDKTREETDGPLSAELPPSVIAYVARTREALVCRDLAGDKRFANDAYVGRHAPRSVLCMPLLNMGEPIALLYLENNLATGVFGAERVEVLQVLGAQAAISIENAQLYEDLEQKVAERTVALADRSAQLEQANRALSLARDDAESASRAKGAFLANVSHELRTPLNTILGFASLLRDRLRDAETGELVKAISVSGRALQQIIDDVLDLSRIEADKMVLKPRRAIGDPGQRVRSHRRRRAGRGIAVIHRAESDRGGTNGGREMSDAAIRHRILVVDDDPESLRYITTLLKSKGDLLHVATEGALALRIAREVSPDIILLDIQMPGGMDGIETCRRLKAEDATKAIPVLFLTGRDDQPSPCSNAPGSWSTTSPNTPGPRKG